MFTVQERILGQERSVHFYENGDIIAEDETGDYLPRYWQFKNDIASWKYEKKLENERWGPNTWVQFDNDIRDKFIEYFVDKELLGE